MPHFAWSWTYDREIVGHITAPAPPLPRLCATVHPFPEWFSQFLNDRQTRKPSAHTMKAYRQDFIAIATLVTNGDPAQLAATDMTKESPRAAFAAYVRTKTSPRGTLPVLTA